MLLAASALPLFAAVPPSATAGPLPAPAASVGVDKSAQPMPTAERNYRVQSLAEIKAAKSPPPMIAAARTAATGSEMLGVHFLGAAQVGPSVNFWNEAGIGLNMKTTVIKPISWAESPVLSLPSWDVSKTWPDPFLATPAHDWTFTLFGRHYGLVDQGNDRVLYFNGYVLVTTLPFYAVVGLFAAACAAVVYLVYHVFAKRKPG